MYGFNEWNKNEFRAGSIRRASSSNDKVWGEENKTTDVLAYGTFVAVNPDGGVKKITAATDIVHGIVVLDIYGNGAPHDKTTNIGHFSHGDSVAAQGVDDVTFARGDKAYIVMTGADAGKVTNVAEGALDVGYWVDAVNGSVVSVTLGFVKAGA